MFILKCFNLILIILVSTYIGIFKSKQFSGRVVELKKMKSALNVFKSKIEFTYEPIKEIFEEISKIVYQDKENIFKNFCENLGSNDVSKVWNESVEDFESNLTKDDKEIILMLGKLLGKTDKNGQISEIELVSKFLDKQIVDSEEMKSKNEKLYKTLGVVCGLTIAIILV